jgi:hypothetical protein
MIPLKSYWFWLTLSIIAFIYKYPGTQKTVASFRLPALRATPKEKIIFFAGTARQPEIYILAGNYLPLGAVGGESLGGFFSVTPCCAIRLLKIGLWPHSNCSGNEIGLELRNCDTFGGVYPHTLIAIICLEITYVWSRTSQVWIKECLEWVACFYFILSSVALAQLLNS